MNGLKTLLAYLLNPSGKIRNFQPVGHENEDAESVYQQRRLFRRHLFNPSLVIGGIICLFLLLITYLGPFWARQNPHLNPLRAPFAYYDRETNRLIRPPLPPSSTNLLGTDLRGNDTVSKLLYGARVTLVSVAFVTLGRLFLGVTIGSVAGWYHRRSVDHFIMRLIAIIGSIPMLISSMMLIFFLGIDKGLLTFVIALSLVGWTEIAQLVRSELLLLKQKPFVEAAHSVGASELEIVVRHILPNIFPQLIVVTFLEMGAILLLMAELGFLDVFIGGGSQIPDGPSASPITVPVVPEWGLMISEGVPYLRTKPYVIIGPALAFLISIVGFNLLGEGLRTFYEKSGVNSAFLLRKWFWVALILGCVGTYLFIENSGAPFWYARAANAFDEAPIVDRLGALEQAYGLESEDGGMPALPAHVAEQFKNSGLNPGRKQGLQSSYFYQPNPEQTHVMGLWDGYDFNLSGDLVVVLVPYQSFGEDGKQNLLDLAIMFETIRHLKAQDVNPRRSILFVAWQMSDSFPEDVNEYFTNPDEARLTLRTGLTAYPTLLLQLGSDEKAQPSGFWIHPDSGSQLTELITYSANKANATIASDADVAVIQPISDMPWMSMVWLGMSNSKGLQQYGETLALALITLVRDEEAWQPATKPLPSPTAPTNPISAPTETTEELKAIGIVEAVDRQPLPSFHAGQTIQYAVPVTGAPNAYLPGQSYASLRLRMTLSKSSDENTVAFTQGRIDISGAYQGLLDLPETLEPGEYILTITPLSSSYHGYPVELQGDTTISIIIKEN